MKISFVNEDLPDKTGLYIDPDSELSSFLTRIQDGIEAEGIRVDRKFKYVKGKLCKFYLELIDEKNTELIQKRRRLVEGIFLNLNKLKWEIRDNIYIVHIGKISDKELFINVAKLFSETSDEENESIENIKDKITSTTLNLNKPKAPHIQPVYVPPVYVPPPQEQITIQHSTKNVFDTRKTKNNVYYFKVKEY